MTIIEKKVRSDQKRYEVTKKVRSDQNTEGTNWPKRYEVERYEVAKVRTDQNAYATDCEVTC